MEKSPSNFKEIPLTSKVWGERDFDEVSLILLVDDPAAELDERSLGPVSYTHLTLPTKA